MDYDSEFPLQRVQIVWPKKKGRNYKNQFLQGEMHMDNKET